MKGNMLLNKLLNKQEKVIPLEKSYADNKDISASIRYLEDISQLHSKLKIVQIFDDDNVLHSIVVHDPGADNILPHWILLTNLIAQRGIPSPNAAYFHELASGISSVEKLTIQRELLDEALIEFYSAELAESDECKKFVYTGEINRERIARLKKLITSLKIENELRHSIEICCGNGMSTVALHELGYSPLTIDIDMYQLCEGLVNKWLSPKKTILMDATLLSVFYPPDTFSSVLGFMLGTIYHFDCSAWIKIIEEGIQVCRKGGAMVFTVNSDDEIKIISNVMEKHGIIGKVIDNRDEHGLFDQWVYFGRK